MYSIETDKAHALVRLRIWGFWNEGVVRDFLREERQAIVDAGFQSNGYDVLCDVTESAIQPQEVVSAFQEMIEHSPIPAHRIALFTTKQLPRMQARRLASRRGAAMFDSESEAKTWLAAGSS